MSNKTQEILELYKSKVMPTYAPSVVIASGKGVAVRDVDGRSYYDFTSGIGVQSVGYGNKKVVEAIQNQAAALTHCSNLFANAPATQLASKLVELSGLGGKAFF
jgi:acetylornithine/N-succinyldiaminopimelate aminotransferase